MSSWSAIVARIKAQIETIANIGNVWDRDRYVFTESDFDTIATKSIAGDTKVRTWMVHLGKMESSPESSGGHEQWDRLIVIDGYLQMEDAQSSELTAVSLAESIITTLWADARATKLGSTVLYAAPPKLEAITPEFYSHVACHHVKITVAVMTIENP